MPPTLISFFTRQTENKVKERDSALSDLQQQLIDVQDHFQTEVWSLFGRFNCIWKFIE